MIETEVRGILTKEIFESRLNEFESTFTNQSKNKRLTFCFGDFENKNIDIRLRITNNKPVLMQKVGGWEDIQREEIEIELEQDPSKFLNHYKIISNIYKTIPTSFETLIQHENFLFENDQIEIKLTKQFGKNDYYLFEIEALKEDIDLTQKCSEFGLEIQNDFESEENRKFRNQEVNLDPRILEESKIKLIINSYLNA